MIISVDVVGQFCDFCLLCKSEDYEFVKLPEIKVDGLLDSESKAVWDSSHSIPTEFDSLEDVLKILEVVKLSPRIVERPRKKTLQNKGSFFELIVKNSQVFNTAGYQRQRG